MLSGEKKKYSPYLDTGLMDAVSQKAASLDISVNEYITLALIAFTENNPNEVMVRRLIKKLLASPELEAVVIKELIKYGSNE